MLKNQNILGGRKVRGWKPESQKPSSQVIYFQSKIALEIC